MPDASPIGNWHYSTYRLPPACARATGTDCNVQFACIAVKPVHAAHFVLLPALPRCVVVVLQVDGSSISPDTLEAVPAASQASVEGSHGVYGRGLCHSST
jgi:hypothetical protein